MKAPILSILIPWRDRPEIQQTIAANKRIFDRYNLEVVIVNAGGNVNTIKNLINDKIRICTIPTLRFNRSLILNIGAYVARSENLFLMDADVIIEEDFIHNALDIVGKNKVVAINKMLESDSPGPQPTGNKLMEEILTHIELIAKDGRRAILQTNRDSFTVNSRTGNGQVLISKKNFILVNGMNSKLTGWGYEDSDLLIRLQFELGIKVQAYGTVLHLSHNDSTRDTYGMKTIEEHHQINFVTALQLYQDNNFLGTYDHDVKRWATELEALDVTSLIS